MKNIKKTAVLLLGITSGSLLAATLEVNFTDGAEWASAVTGGLKFVGSQNTDDITFSGSATGDVYMNKGNVKILKNTSFGGDIYMTGGRLDVTQDRSLPTIHANSDCRIMLRNNGNDPVSSILNTVDGPGKLTFVGAGDVEIGGDMSANTGGIVTTGADQVVNLVAASKLPAADNTFIGDLNLDAAPTSGSYDASGKILSAQTINVDNAFSGEIQSAYLVGTVKARKVSIGGHKWSVPVTVSAVP